MNLLHTSDWHIGKRLMDRERLSEQEAALSELADICDREDVSVVLVAVFVCIAISVILIRRAVFIIFCAFCRSL